MVNFIAVLIYNLRHQYGRVVLAVIGHGAITICQVQEIDIARSQGQRRFVGKRTGDTHVLGRTDDIGYSHLLTELDGNGVDTLGKGALERDAIAREASIGVGRPPGIVLASLLVKHLHLNILVSALVTGSKRLELVSTRYVELTLADGETKIKLPRYAEFAISFEADDIFYATPDNNETN